MLVNTCVTATSLLAGNAERHTGALVAGAGGQRKVARRVTDKATR
jgi:hypothetical protein